MNMSYEDFAFMPYKYEGKTYMVMIIVLFDDTKIKDFKKKIGISFIKN